ncbi:MULTISPECIES: FIST N-terminal domain-containing protein [Sphingomonadaceae]|uniref:FIST N-terminal domain-containing protein n=1 Tax=unclassified Novosphingobium TaxID=2644732 RepID=UPI0015CEC921
MRTCEVGVASSHASDPVEAFAQITRRIDPDHLAGAVMFCSHRYDREALARAARGWAMERFAMIGCTSSGELTEAGYDEDSISLIGFPADSFHMVSHRFDDLAHFDAGAARAAVRDLVARAEVGSASLGDKVNHAALFLVDGLSHSEELLAMTVQDALGEIPLVGGSSGDGLMFKETGIYSDGAFHAAGAVVAILSTTRPLHVFRRQHYKPGAVKMVVTEADAGARRVTEINAEPAAREYLRLASSIHGGIDPTRPDMALFAACPPMVRAGGDYHVRAVQSANADGSLTFYCAIDEGIVLTLGEPVDQLESLNATMAEIRAAVGEIDHIIAFDCVLNRINAERRQLGRPISEIYRRHGVMGFNTYGEQFHALHVNQTFSGLAIGR